MGTLIEENMLKIEEKKKPSSVILKILGTNKNTLLEILSHQLTTLIKFI